MPEIIQGTLQWIGEHPGLLAVAIVIFTFLECLALFGAIFPGMLLLVPLSLAAMRSGTPLPLALLLATSGAFSANLLSYVLGYRLQRMTGKLALLRKNPAWLVHAQNYLQRYGAASIFFAQFIGLLRPVLPLVAGSLQMPPRLFVSVSLLASLGWSAMLVLPAWVAVNLADLEVPEGFWRQASIPLLELLAILAISYYLTKRQFPWRYLSIAVCSALMLLTLTLSWHRLAPFDSYLLQLIQQYRSPLLEPGMLLATLLGDVRVQLALLAGLATLLALYRSGSALLFVASCVVISYGTTLAIKHLFQRPRPDILLEPLTSYSFASGHSARGFLFFLILAILLNRGLAVNWRMLVVGTAVVAGSLTAFSRLYLGAHWPTDIIAGCLIAIASCSLSLGTQQQLCPVRALPASFWYWYAALASLIMAAAGWLGYSATLARYAG